MRRDSLLIPALRIMGPDAAIYYQTGCYKFGPMSGWNGLMGSQPYSL